MTVGWEVSSHDFFGLDGPSLPHIVYTPATVELDWGQIPAQHTGLNKVWMYPGTEDQRIT